MDIWAKSKDVKPELIEGILIRVVESQTQVATNSIVDNIDEQVLLETLLEDSKPPVPNSAMELNYLLSTPFRYPPLKHGSRFGNKQQPSLFYGSLSIPTALSETAYYRFVFWSGMTKPPPNGLIQTQHTIFGAKYKTAKGLKLQNFPFSQYEKRLVSPSSYIDTQLLGSTMRENEIKAFEYISARDKKSGINVALFSAEALASDRPTFKEAFLCELRNNTVTFAGHDRRLHSFLMTDFLIKNKLPMPAA